ncbi:hypothetical protein Zmor_012190 [Zophobas morio]|uniref:Phosphotransferase system EIIC domain-containing protein n=1 Tax=Zophobas morio TaxID=2755281 RepID=A0AA38LZG3_9CUCU|nr:hypothetical protein Zmor_012190 [Zophobas morio]
MDTLSPVLAMAGTAQVGTALALFLKAKKGSKIRQQISGTIVPAIFGIGEPLIYGVTLVRPRAFASSCVGAATGAIFFGLLPLFGVNIGKTALGPSGLLAAPLMTSNHGIGLGVGLYLLGSVITYCTGFVAT